MYTCSHYCILQGIELTKIKFCQGRHWQSSARVHGLTRRKAGLLRFKALGWTCVRSAGWRKRLTSKAQLASGRTTRNPT